MGCVSAIAGHWHRGQCRRHRHSGIWHLNPVPEHSGIGLDPLIPVPDSSRHRHFNSFRYRTDWMPYSRAFRLLKTLYKGEEGYTLHVYTTGGEKEYTLHVHTAHGEDGYTRHVNGIGSPASGLVRYRWSRISPALPSCG
jgi:hypothetical protein